MRATSIAPSNVLTMLWDKTHAVGLNVADDQGAAFAEACRYADGTNVMCATVLRLSDGLIADQAVVQAWDES